MVRPTHDQIIRELSNDVALLKSQMEELRTAVDCLADLNTRVALLEYQVAELRRGPERWGQRLWMVPAPLIAGAAGVLLAYYLNVKK